MELFPFILLRLVRQGYVQWEDKRMDEHIYVTYRMNGLPALEYLKNLSRNYQREKGL